MNLISLSEEGPDRGQEGRAGRQGAGVRGGGQEERGQTGPGQGAAGGQPVLPLLQLQLPLQPLQSLLKLIHLHFGVLYLPPSCFSIWRSGQMLCSASSQPLCLATLAFRLRTLAGMALVCSSSPSSPPWPRPSWPSPCYMLGREGPQKHKCQICKTAKLRATPKRQFLLTKISGMI